MYIYVYVCIYVHDVDGLCILRIKVKRQSSTPAYDDLARMIRNDHLKSQQDGRISELSQGLEEKLEYCSGYHDVDS